MCEWTSFPPIPSPPLQVFQLRPQTDIGKKRQAFPTVSCLNSWPHRICEHHKLLFFATKFLGCNHKNWKRRKLPQLKANIVPDERYRKFFSELRNETMILVVTTSKRHFPGSLRQYYRQEKEINGILFRKEKTINFGR